jgi:hypothetical protein
MLYELGTSKSDLHFNNKIKIIFTRVETVNGREEKKVDKGTVKKTF